MIHNSRHFSFDEKQHLWFISVEENYVFEIGSLPSFTGQLNFEYIFAQVSKVRKKTINETLEAWKVRKAINELATYTLEVWKVRKTITETLEVWKVRKKLIMKHFTNV